MVATKEAENIYRGLFNSCEIEHRKKKYLKTQAPQESSLEPSLNKLAHRTDLVVWMSYGEDLETKFRDLSTKWRRETGALSITTKKITHPAYYQIIALGPRVVPLILRDMEARPAHWFTALEALTGIDPVRPEHRGRHSLMQQDWLEYGRANRLI